ncbi:hypothetical protein ABZW47_31340 [Streptomyces sp. NPDC004549]|uniref:hypothetical protein n=1 Tax=Streptomyces sp. NPDC004549 TaxID=3154283 RepID=UPI0033ABAFB4
MTIAAAEGNVLDLEVDQPEAAAMPRDVAELLETLRARLTDLADHRPLAALTAAAHLEATEEAVSVRAAAAWRSEGGSWSSIGAARGVSKQAAHQRFARRVTGRKTIACAPLPHGEPEKAHTVELPPPAEPAVTAPPASVGSAQPVVIEEPAEVWEGQIVPDESDFSPQARVRRFLLAYQEGPGREHPYAGCPACQLTGPPGSISALWHPDGTIDWATLPRVRCTFCSTLYQLDPADVAPYDSTTACSRCGVTIRHPGSASQIECPCCHLVAPGPADEDFDLRARRRLTETGNIRRMQTRLQEAKDRNPGLAERLAGPLRAQSVRLDLPASGQTAAETPGH